MALWQTRPPWTALSIPGPCGPSTGSSAAWNWGKCLIWIRDTVTRSLTNFCEEKTRSLCFRFYLKTFIQASLWFQAPQPKGIKLYWSLMAWKVSFWIKAHPVTNGGVGMEGHLQVIWKFHFWSGLWGHENSQQNTLEPYRGQYNSWELFSSRKFSFGEEGLWMHRSLEGHWEKMK